MPFKRFERFWLPFFFTIEIDKTKKAFAELLKVSFGMSSKNKTLKRLHHLRETAKVCKKAEKVKLWFQVSIVLKLKPNLTDFD